MSKEQGGGGLGGVWTLSKVIGFLRKKPSLTGCRIIDNGLFRQISVKTAFKQKLAGKLLEQKPAGTVFE